jgi:hypothetical protein
MTGAIIFLCIACNSFAVLAALLTGCTCVVNEAPAGRAVDGGAELDDSGAG